MLMITIMLIVVSAVLITSIGVQRKEQDYLENQYNVYCGSCHLVPNPENIPKSLWKNKVLPEMAKRMGLKSYNDGSQRYSDLEKQHIKLNNGYPELPLLDNLKWQEL